MQYLMTISYQSLVPYVKGVLQRTFFISTDEHLCTSFTKIVIILFLSKAVFIKRTLLF